MTVVDAEKVSEFKLAITHLVTVGCSFTYCQGLDNKLENGWPAIIAKKLNIPLVNLGSPGVGNDSIHRKTYEYFYENLPTNSNPLFIIAWTQYWRREAWVKTHYRMKFDDYAPVSMNQTSPKDAHEQAVFEDWSDIDHARRTFNQKLSLINLFSSYNTPYLMTDYSTIMDREQIEEKIKKILPRSVEEINFNKNKIKNFYSISQNHPKTECGHDGLSGNLAIAEYTLSEIKNRYNNFTNTHQHLTLSEYIKNQKYMLKFPEWCNFTL